MFDLWEIMKSIFLYDYDFFFFLMGKQNRFIKKMMKQKQLHNKLKQLEC